MKNDHDCDNKDINGRDKWAKAVHTHDAGDCECDHFWLWVAIILILIFWG